MSRTIDFNKHKESREAQIVQEVVCLSCLHRWIAVRNAKIMLKELQCQKCEKIGNVIATGQQIEVKE